MAGSPRRLNRAAGTSPAGLSCARGPCPRSWRENHNPNIIPVLISYAVSKSCALISHAV